VVDFATVSEGRWPLVNYFYSKQLRAITFRLRKDIFPPFFAATMRKEICVLQGIGWCWRNLWA